jgi:5-methylcytosine-specific restriction endonuclease McrA
LCRDGTYSFSAHRSGTCSHHGGVAKWLTGSSSATAAGKTVRLEPRNRTSGCVLGANPDRRCSPGAYYSRLTKAVICSAGFRTSSIRNVPDSERFAVEEEYGMTPGHYGSALEVDHIIALELGGSNDIANLFPEKANARPGYRVKDRLENRLHEMVCDGSMTLRAARFGISSNWQTLYRRVFGAAPVG